MTVVPSDAGWPFGALGTADGPCRDAGGGWVASGKPRFGAAIFAAAAAAAPPPAAAAAPPPEAATAGASAAVLGALGEETAVLVRADENGWTPVPPKVAGGHLS